MPQTRDVQPRNELPATVGDRSRGRRAGDPGSDSANDAALARQAARQRGLVTRAQARSLGLSDGAIDERLRRGALHRVQRGVFLVGHAVPPPFAAELAAVLACGPDTLVARSSALALWGLPFASQAGDPVDVLIVGRKARSRHGLRARRCSALARQDATRRHGIPVTAAARTVVDLAGDLHLPDLEELVNEVQVRRLASSAALRGALDRGGPRHGAGRLRAILAEPDLGVTRSRAERRLRGILRSAGLPAPRTNARVAGYEHDMLWAEQRLIVEIDGFAAHGTRRAFERDRRRDARLQVAGYRTVRVTWRQIEGEPVALAARLAVLLAAPQTFPG